MADAAAPPAAAAAAGAPALTTLEQIEAALPNWEVLAEAYRRFDNDEWEAASEVITAVPGHEGVPRYLAALAEFKWWWAMFTEVDADVAASERRIEAAAALARSHRESNIVVQKVMAAVGAAAAGVKGLVLGVRTPKEVADPAATTALALLRLDCLLVEAEATAFRAIIQIKTGHMIRGANTARSAFNLYVSCESHEARDAALLAGRPELAHLRHGIAFGANLFRFIMSMVPPSVKWLTDVMGFRGDRDVALAGLAEIAGGVSYRSTNASLATAGVAGMQDGRHAAALAQLDALATKVPTSSTLNFLRGYIMRDMGNVEGAIVAFTTAVDRAPVPQLQCNASRDLGRCYLGVGDWPAAEARIRFFLENGRAPTWKPWARVQLAVALAAQGQGAAAAELIGHVGDDPIEERHSFSGFAARIAATVAVSGALSPVLLAYLQAYYARDCAQWDRGLEAIAAAEKEVEASAAADAKPVGDYLGMLAYMKGSLHRGAKRWAEAEAAFDHALAQGATLLPASGTEAWTLYELGLCHIEAKRKGPAVDCLTRAQAIPLGFNLDRMLQYKVKRSLDEAKKMRE